MSATASAYFCRSSDGRNGKSIMNTSTQTLPGGYVHSGEINLKKDECLAFALNIVVFFVFIIIFYLLVIIGAVGLLLIMLAPVSWLLMIAFLVALNTGGAMGDLLVFIRLLKCSPTSFANDTGEVVTFFECL
jgi:hypothetical protein